MKFLAELHDDTFPFRNVSIVKHAARAFVFDKNKYIALINFSGDYQGNRFDFHATPGGGIEPGETPEMAIKREVLEELGIECNILHEVGIIIDYNNDEERKFISYYFIVEATDKKQKRWTDEEKKSIKGIAWMNIKTAIELLEKTPLGFIGGIIQRRDLYALNEAKKILNL